jgi:ribosome-binding factor A
MADSRPSRERRPWTSGGSPHQALEYELMSERMRRVNESVRQVLAEAVPELKDPRIGLITVTGVDTASDLRHATVYVSVLGSGRKQRASLLGLEAAHGVLQARLARELRLKRTPQLSFEYDPTVERGVRMTRLIDELAPNDDDPDD